MKRLINLNEDTETTSWLSITHILYIFCAREVSVHTLNEILLYKNV